MRDKLKRLLGFPYPREYEDGFNRDLMKSMHKPLLVALTAILLFVTWLVWICVFFPETIAPAAYIRGLTMIHLVFLAFTILALTVSVAFRRQLFQYPKGHVALCNTYAVGVCLWGSFLSAYASYSPAIYTAFIFVVLCVSMVSMYKPWLALVAFPLNYIAYITLLYFFSPAAFAANTMQLFNSAVAAIVGMTISIAFYRFRTRNYYDRQIIEQQMREIHDMNLQLQQLVHVDNLTGLFNRRFYEEKLPEHLAGFHAAGDLCCMMFDIDYFKRYNDQYGHPAGDGALRFVSKTIRTHLEAHGAYAIRYGGEEMFALVPVASAEQALDIAGAICHELEAAYIPHAASPYKKVTLSCGVAYCAQGEPCSLEDLTAKADKALYTSKNSGRSRVTLFSP